MIKQSEVESWLSYHEQMISRIGEIVEDDDLDYAEKVRAFREHERHRVHTEMLNGLLQRMEPGEPLFPNE
jgi:hypothetical protein